MGRLLRAIIAPLALWSWTLKPSRWIVPNTEKKRPRIDFSIPGQRHSQLERPLQGKATHSEVWIGTLSQGVNLVRQTSTERPGRLFSPA